VCFCIDVWKVNDVIRTGANTIPIPKQRNRIGTIKSMQLGRVEIKFTDSKIPKSGSFTCDDISSFPKIHPGLPPQMITANILNFSYRSHI